jgi:AAA domain
MHHDRNRATPPSKRPWRRTTIPTPRARFIYRIVRLGPEKQFFQQRPAPGYPGSWAWGLTAGKYVRHDRGGDFYEETKDRTPANGWNTLVTLGAIEHGLYNFPEIVQEMSKPEGERRTIWVAEGEKDCATLSALGLVATTNSGGAKHWNPRHAEHLRGANVVVAIDNDEAGCDRGRAVATSLQGVASRVRVLDLKDHWADIGDKDDVTDWLSRGGGTPDKLKEIVEQLPDWVDRPAADGVAAPAALRILSLFDQQGRVIKERDWLIRDWIPRGVVTGLYGDGAVGKTLLSMQLQSSTALVSGSWMGLLIDRQIPSLGVYCEDDEEELMRRYRDINKGYHIDFAHLSGAFFLPRLGYDNVLVRFARNGTLELTPFYHQLLQQCLDRHIELLILDVAASFFAGNENDRAQVHQFVHGALGRIAQAIAGAVVMCAQPSVAGMNSGEGTSGSTGWNNAFRSRMYLERVKPDLGVLTDTDARILSRMNANYGPQNDEVMMHYKDGLFVPDALQFGGGQRRSIEDVYLDLLVRMIAQGQRFTAKKGGVDYPPLLFSSLSADARDGYTRPSFERAHVDLLQQKRIEIVTTGPVSKERQLVVPGLVKVRKDND